LNKTSHHWRKTAVAVAAMALLGLCGESALALSLGRITVQSALSEPLRAEIDIPDINADEASSLRVNAAPPEAFVAAGLEYNPAIVTLQANLARRPNGSAYLRLTSERAINDPFVDLILEASWSSGRIVRDYTMLFDPTPVKPANALGSANTVFATPVAQPALPQIAGTAVTPSRPAPRAAAPMAAPPPAATNRPAKVVAAPASAAASSVDKIDANSGKTLVVKSGDTASKIALQIKPRDISLDQMLVALIRTNPDAFERQNLNRLRAGAVLNLPGADQAGSVPTAQATQMVIAQSKDFNAFRRNLAANAPLAAVDAPKRNAAGGIEAKVQDQKPSSTAPDKLTLSKGTVASKGNEAALAKERADADAAARAAEMAKNLSDLSKLQSAAKAPVAAAAPSAAASAAPASNAAAKAAASSTTAVSAAPLAAAVSVPGPAAVPAPVAAPASAPMPRPAPAASAATLPEDPGLVDQFLQDPLLPSLAGVAAALLLGGLYVVRKRQSSKKAAQVDSSFLESRLQPDSFFGASGGQRVDTGNDGPVSASSMAYASSQLEHADDVDPVAEADVYLAYGRDLQAEEILKEALRHNPSRVAIHSKLLEIFAKRRDAASFQSSAMQAFKLTGADSPEWHHICELGLSIDPENRLYQPGGATVSVFGALERAAGDMGPPSQQTVPMETRTELDSVQGNVDLDLDLDFSDDDRNSTVVLPTAPALEAHMPAPVAAVSQPAALSASMLDNALEFTASDLGELSAPAPAAEPSARERTEPAPIAGSTPSSNGMLEFDLGSLSLDLDPAPGSNSATNSVEHALETKLALADEFVSIGDHDGARALLEEVMAEASGALHEKASQALNSLN